MAEMTIRLETDPVTGRKNILVDLKSDEDLLPHEHEEQHRKLVDKLIEGGLLSADEVGKVIISREESTETALPASESTPQPETRSEEA